MPDPVRYDAHVQIYIRAEEVARANNPPVVPELIELRRKFDLGAYTAERFSELLDEVEECVEQWVEDNPPE